MDIFSLFTLCGGLAFFLYGMTVMSKSLEKMAGGKLEHLLKRMTSNPIKSLVLGAGITIAIQSSSALTVMLVGLVNSGVMKLGQTVGVIMGSNIGTTLTAWILSLAGIESSNVFLRMMKPENFSPVIALVGIILIMAGKKQKQRDVGRIMIGFAILMYGMELMKDSVAPLADMPEFASLLTAFNNPMLGVAVGAIFTGIIQSSAASVGILQALALTGSITYGMAIPIIMGQNIGTCVTALISSIGVNRNARRVAVIHISFNLIGTIVFLVLFYGGNMLFHFTFMDATIGAAGIALCHSIFNVCTTIMLLPFGRQLEKIAVKVIPTKEDQPSEQIAFLDPRVLQTPSIALGECVSMSHKMGKLAQANLKLAMAQLDEYEDTRAAEMAINEEHLDLYDDRLGKYLVEISRQGISEKDMRTVSRLLHIIGNFERIGDHAMNLQAASKDMHDKGLTFSEQGSADLKVLRTALEDVAKKSFVTFRVNCSEGTREVEPLEEAIDQITDEIRKRHIRRMQQGKCSIELSWNFNELLVSLERISDLCSNVAFFTSKAADRHPDRHSYRLELRHKGEFSALLFEALEKYKLSNKEY